MLLYQVIRNTRIMILLNLKGTDVSMTGWRTGSTGSQTELCQVSVNQILLVVNIQVSGNEILLVVNIKVSGNEI